MADKLLRDGEICIAMVLFWRSLQRIHSTKQQM
jgi:hypothetical protein